MQGYRTYSMDNHHLHHPGHPLHPHHPALHPHHLNGDNNDQKPIMLDLLSNQYGKPQTPPPSPTTGTVNLPNLI